VKRLAIIGSADLAKQIAHFALECGYGVTGYFDDFKEKGVCDGRQILGKIAEVRDLYDGGRFDEIIVGVGYKNMEFRKGVFEEVKTRQIPFATIVHPSCIIDKTASIGPGTIVYPGCIIDQDVAIQENVLLNLGCLVSHNSTIHEHCYLSPAVNIAGCCEVGKQCNLGINTTLIDNISICDLVHTGGATVVTKSISKPGLYVGVPAKFVR
jgi:sugar O-acyltransferase (sialic acid O-acetyltransferase NeuD family)